MTRPTRDELVGMLVNWIQVWDGWAPDRRVGRTTRIESARIRADEDPPSAALHFTLDGKEYVAVIQPTDLPGLPPRPE